MILTADEEGSREVETAHHGTEGVVVGASLYCPLHRFHFRICLRRCLVRGFFPCRLKINRDLAPAQQNEGYHSTL